MLPKLERIQIHLTNKCNLKCAFCDVPFRRWGKDLSDGKWLELIKEINELRPHEVIISGGGEPFLRSELLIKIIKDLKENGIKIGIITNGTLISEEIAQALVNFCDDLRISIHGTTPKEDAFLRGVNGSLKLSEEGIKRVVYWKEKMKREKPLIDIAMVLTRFNIMRIPQMIKNAIKLKVNVITLRIVNELFKRKRFSPSEKQLKFLAKNLEKYKNIAKLNGLDLHCDFREEDIFSNPTLSEKSENSHENFPACLIPFKELVIFADGRCSPCCNFVVTKRSVAVDSIKRKTIEKVWFGKKFSTFRERMIARKYLPKVCKVCTPDIRRIHEEYKEKLTKL
jgi:radical SAM protein with 4Fe4S-binding SPASM domain